jgi:hypothetical protein
MPYQNRVNPCGMLIETSARGRFTGNRGHLHDEHKQIRRHYETPRWLMCRLDYPKPTHTVMALIGYTHLFFLDEPTALAAGHRPCALCMRSRFNQFRDYWMRVHASTTRPSAADIDAVLHEERITPEKHKRTYSASLTQLPSGCFVMLTGSDQPYLVQHDQLLAWQPDGYADALARPSDQTVTVLTPPSIVHMLAAGYPLAS